jgi:hypothetical protein
MESLRELIIKEDLFAIVAAIGGDMSRGREAIHLAAKLNNQYILQSLVCKGFTIPPSAVYEAAYNGNLELLKYLLERDGVRYRADSMVSYYAAIGGREDCLRYLYTHGYHIDENVCEYAAIGNSVACLEFLYYIGYPLTGRTFSAMVRNGNLNGLCWLHSHSCPHESRMYSHIIDDECAKWLRLNGYNV